MNQFNKRKYFILTFLCITSMLFLSMTCEDDGEIEIFDIVFVNSTHEQILYCQSDKPISVKNAVAPHSFYSLDTLQADSSVTLTYRLGYPLPFCLMIIKQSTIEKYSWKNIVDNDICDKRYIFTLEDLQEKNLQINYQGESSIEIENNNH